MNDLVLNHERNYAKMKMRRNEQKLRLASELRIPFSSFQSSEWIDMKIHGTKNLSREL